MKADQIRLMFDYHFAANRNLWDGPIAALTDEQFTQAIPYSLGSIRNHCVHLMSVDQSWIGELRTTERIPYLNLVHYPKRPKIRAKWDEIETTIRETLATLTDARMEQAFDSGTPTPAWLILLHVINHGTDHRAQLLAGLHSLGAPTMPQDLVLYAWGKLPGMKK